MSFISALDYLRVSPGATPIPAGSRADPRLRLEYELLLWGYITPSASESMQYLGFYFGNINAVAGGGPLDWYLFYMLWEPAAGAIIRYRHDDGAGGYTDTDYPICDLSGWPSGTRRRFGFYLSPRGVVSPWWADEDGSNQTYCESIDFGVNLPRTQGERFFGYYADTGETFSLLSDLTLTGTFAEDSPTGNPACELPPAQNSC